MRTLLFFLFFFLDQVRMCNLLVLRVGTGRQLGTGVFVSESLLGMLENCSSLF